MDNITHLGLDMHKDTIAVAILRPGELSPDQRVIANTPEALRKLVARCGDPASLLACYEAGPTGYDTHRLLTALGVRCDVIAPALTPRRVGLRVKTDGIDAATSLDCTGRVNSPPYGSLPRAKRPYGSSCAPGRTQRQIAG